MLGAILTVAVLAALGVFGYVLCWQAGEFDDQAEREQKERYKNE